MSYPNLFGRGMRRRVEKKSPAFREAWRDFLLTWSIVWFDRVKCHSLTYEERQWLASFRYDKPALLRQIQLCRERLRMLAPRWCERYGV